MKRVFLVVLDSFGIGEMPDADQYLDAGSNTLKACSGSQKFYIPNMKHLGLFNIDGVDVSPCKEDWSRQREQLAGVYGRLTEASKGKDTTIGHWEIAGHISECPLPTFPNGFPQELLNQLEEKTGRKIICNKPYSGTEVIKDYGEEHVKTGALIVYTSADSVLQIAAHESIVSIEELYRYCEIARELCTGETGVGRVIARPFEGEAPNFQRTKRRHDYSLTPPGVTMLDQLLEKDFDVIAVGKIYDIFAGKSISSMIRTSGNEEGIEKTLEYMEKEFEGLCFINLVDFDMLYGHRNDVDGYAEALTYFDKKLPDMIKLLGDEDILMITADHGCDPSTPSTDHSREYTPLLMYGKPLKEDVNLGTRESFADISATILDYFQIPCKTKGTSFLEQIVK
ncbi:phosphopentomutase [Anaeromicropila populeti]|uniref:Phosphopentomutase n=1 Tax=Anaeromicropila populeti TaxID=37658 RepID=A0A1I6I895_9FIRM|nr:phosphopentomutase [Anaeromicropila populeti]SFR62965.1 phosphopentomutase [Anaeromicropila populeti]